MSSAMVLKKFYLKCLSHGSYFLADQESREAAVIDPRRDAKIYRRLLQDEGYRLKYVLETHIHADFVSGHSELAAQTGATIVFGEKARARMDHLPVKDGDILMLGQDVRITVLETPGHTPESVCYLAQDLADPESPPKLFSGDTLFVGDVGRPDLLGTAMPAMELASRMYDTVTEKLLTLPDATAYFSEDARINREGPEILDKVLARLRPLRPAELEAEMKRGAILIDTRGPEDYARGSIPGALQIGLDGQFASWVGSLVPKGKTLVILAEPGREEEAALRCARVGHDGIIGYLEGGITAWMAGGRQVESYRRVDTEELASMVGRPTENLILDVRRPAERAESFIPGTLHIPLNRLVDRIGELPRGEGSILVHCASGYRSAIAVSLLRRNGFRKVRDVAGGMRLYVENGHSVFKDVKPGRT